jgi:hypothetical protein
MGSICSICAETNPAFTPTGNSLEENSEKAIALAENKCPISKRAPQAIRKSIQPEAMNGRLSLTQMKRAGGSLGLDRVELQNPDSATFGFINTLCTNDEDAYDERRLLVSSVLISNAGAKEKAQILVETYDVNQSQILGRHELRHMIEELFDLSIDSLPKLATSSSKMVSDGIGEYLSKLRVCREQFVEHNLQVLLKGQPEVGRGKACEVLENEARYLLSSNGVRCEVFRKYVTRG